MTEADEQQLPRGWAVATLAAILEPRSGKADPQDNPEARFIGMEQVEAHTMRLRGTVPAGAMKSGANRFEPGDVLYGRLRAYLNKVYQPDFSGLCSGEFIVFPETSAVTGKFLKYRLNAADFVRFASRMNTGDRPRVDFDQLKSFELLLPPRTQQDRIADALDELFSELDAGLAALEQVREKLKLYRASVLKAAVEGALTAEWRAHHPDVEAASELLERILAERRRRWEEDQLALFKAKGQEPPKGWKAKYKQPKSPATTSDLELPFGWTWATVDIVASGRAGAIQSGPFGSQLLHSEFVREGILAIGIDNVLEGHFSLGREHRITPSKFESLKKFEARPGDVVITVMATVGRVCVLPQTLETAIITKHCYRVTPIDGLIDSGFLALTLRAHSSTRHHIFGNVRGQTRPGINGPILKAAPVPVPPIQEQQMIMELVDDQLSIIEHIEADLDTKLQNAKNLRQAILRHAFTGQLVPQNPNDEPAAELLKRIAAEREARELRTVKTKSPEKTKARSN